MKLFVHLALTLLALGIAAALAQEPFGLSDATLVLSSGTPTLVPVPASDTGSASTAIAQAIVDGAAIGARHAHNMEPGLIAGAAIAHILMLIIEFIRCGRHRRFATTMRFLIVASMTFWMCVGVLEIALVTVQLSTGAQHVAA